MSPIDHSADDAAPSRGNAIKRAPVVYGKRSNSNSLPCVAPTSELEQSSERRPIHDTRTASSPSPSIQASDSEPSRASVGADPFQFGFRHRLKELDEQFDDYDAQPSKSGVSPSEHTMPAGLSQSKDPQIVSMGTPILSPQARHPIGNASLSPSPTSLPATEDPPASPPLHRRARGIRNRVLSDSEAEGPSDSSSVSPVRHAITTPHTRSSPTPPTSGETSMLSRKTKGKTPARDVLPLLFETQLSAVEAPIKSRKGRRSEPSARKTKAPTKKERREAALESSRIAANRPVEVHRTQSTKHTFGKFLARLRQESNVPATSGTELPSDPIDRFSSPNDKLTRVPPSNSLFGEPIGLLASTSRTSKQSSPTETHNMPPLAAADSDEEMSSITAIIQQASGKKEERLREAKQIALRRADMSQTLDDDSDDDSLLIVKDDMHAVAREEAAQRRLDKAHHSPTKDMALLRRINHPSARPVAVSPLKFSNQDLQEFAKPSFAHMGNVVKSRLSKNQLDQVVILRHNSNQLESIKRHEAEWVKGGGKLSRDGGGDTQTSLSQRLEAYAERRLKTVEATDAVEYDESADESDEEYTPDVRGSESPQPMETSEAEPADNISQSPQPIHGEEGEEEVVAPSRRRKSGQRRPRVVLASDDEEEQAVHHSLLTMQRDSTSSMESQTEDENDKENSARLMYDRSDDKENKAVMYHESSAFTLGSSLGSLHVVEDDIGRNPPSLSVTGFNAASRSPKEDVRSPLKDISKDQDDPFLLTPSKSPFTERLLCSAARSPPRSCPSTVSLGSPPVLRSERINRITRLPPDPEIDENDPPEIHTLQSSFLERLHGRGNCGPSSLTSLNPLANGGLSQLFSADDQCLKRPVDGTENDGLSLTLDVGLKPALEISGVLQQKAEAIFEKEQEYVVAAAVQESDKPKERLYINDDGFLTQTRPEGPSPAMCRMTPFQVSKLAETQAHTTQSPLPSVRSPLRTLSFAASLDFSPETQPLRRLRKLSTSPLEQRVLGQKSPDAKLNAFDVLGKAPRLLPNKQNEKQKKSEFVAVEAEESDEDDMFGFGGPKGVDDEEDDDDQDKVVEGLVDDTVMDAQTEAAHLVQEKFREHEEQDDERLQKLHQDAVDGKLRIKRRGLGVDLEDNSDEDDNEDHRIRQRIHKKRRIEGDTLEALGQNEETRAFYNTYHQDLVDEDDDFAHLREDVVIPVDDGVMQAEEPEAQETVSVDEIRQRVRELAQNHSEEEVLDPEDTSWIDQSMAIELEEAFHVKVVGRRGKTTGRHPNATSLDFEQSVHPMDDKEREQLQFWARNQRHQYQGTGRSGNSAAVTGHRKGGSLRSARSSTSVHTAGGPYKTKTSKSLLSTVSDRSGKFA